MAHGPALPVTRVLAVVAVVCSLASLTACTGTSYEAARSLARQACTIPGPSVPAGFDARTADPSLLSALAESAASRRAVAEQAAAEDDRWQVLADAAGAISSFAGVLRDARAVGAEVDRAVTPQMWHQYKYASDAFIVECRAAL